VEGNACVEIRLQKCPLEDFEAAAEGRRLAVLKLQLLVRLRRSVIVLLCHGVLELVL